MSTIIAHGYLTQGRKPAPHIAGMLLCAIISDTLNLTGPTTTNWDKMMVSILAIIAGAVCATSCATQSCFIGGFPALSVLPPLPPCFLVF